LLSFDPDSARASRSVGGPGFWATFYLAQASASCLTEKSRIVSLGLGISLRREVLA